MSLDGQLSRPLLVSCSSARFLAPDRTAGGPCGASRRSPGNPGCRTVKQAPAHPPRGGGRFPPTPALSLRAAVPDVPRLRHQQGDPTPDGLPQPQQDQPGLRRRRGRPSKRHGPWDQGGRRRGQPGGAEHPVAGPVQRAGERRPGAALR